MQDAFPEPNLRQFPGDPKLLKENISASKQTLKSENLTLLSGRYISCQVFFYLLRHGFLEGFFLKSVVNWQPAYAPSQTERQPVQAFHIIPCN